MKEVLIVQLLKDFMEVIDEPTPDSNCILSFIETKCWKNLTSAFAIRIANDSGTTIRYT